MLKVVFMSIWLRSLRHVTFASRMMTKVRVESPKSHSSAVYTVGCVCHRHSVYVHMLNRGDRFHIACPNIEMPPSLITYM